MAEKIMDFDMADALDSDEVIAEHLTQVFADGDSDEIVRALGHVAKARGMSMDASQQTAEACL